MSKWLHCDGCGIPEHTEIGFDGKNIKRIYIAISWSDKKDTEGFGRDLCRTCEAKLKDAHDPKNWPEAKAAA